MKPGGLNTGMLWLASPLLVATFLLVLAPAMVTFFYAFTEYDALSAPRFNGFANFVRLQQDPLFWKALLNSLYVAAIGVPLRLLLALGLALLLAKQWQGSRVARTAAYMPSVVPDVAYALLWLWLLNPVYGPIITGLQALGLPGSEWMMSAWGARWSIVLMGLFQIGEVYVVLLASRRELPGELYELCAMEGASAWFVFRRVTLPLLFPVIVFLAARDVAWSLQYTFVPSLVVTKGGPNYATLFLPLYVYQNGFEYLKFGLASAMTIAMFFMTALMVAVQMLVLRLGQARS
jgi:multiple sugar transport system permease protein